MGKAIGAVFTAIVAPIVVVVITQHFNKHDKKDDTGKAGERHKSGPSAAVRASVIVADGVGRTNEEATQNAFRNAIASAVTGLVGADAFARYNALITTRVLPQSEAYISHYAVKVSNRETSRGHDTYHKQIAATVDHAELTTALKALHIQLEHD